MAKQTINIGTAPNDGTGTPLRTAFDYTNQNFTELYTATGPSGNNIVVPGSATITGNLTVDTNTLFVDSVNNRVGIGTASPNAAVEVRNAGAQQRWDSGGATDARVELWANSLRQGLIGWNSNSIVFGGDSARNTVMTWQDVGGVAGTAMTLNSTGLGVGASPSTRLHISNTGDVYARIATTSVSKAGVQLSANGVVRSHLLYDDGAGTTYLTTGTSFGGSGQALVIQSGTSLGFYTNNQLATANMTLDASGNLLVGKTANYGTGETQTLQLKSSVVFASDNTGSASNRNWSIGTNASAAGNMEWTISSTNTGWPNFAYRLQLTSAGALNNTTGTYGTISDLRLKENISDARNYLADLLKLRVVKYSLKEEASAVATKLGFIAQEVEQVFPNLVDQSDKEYEGAEGIRSVKTSILIPMLLKAIQELTARVQTLEAR